MRAVVRSSARAISSSPERAASRSSDDFTPFNQRDLNNQDLEAGSAGVALAGDKARSRAHPNLMVVAGKKERFICATAIRLGGWQAGADSQIVESVPGQISSIFGNPAYFNQTVDFCGSGDPLVAFPIANPQLAAAPKSWPPLVSVSRLPSHDFRQRYYKPKRVDARIVGNPTCL
jgi:hypothetical protein